MSRGNREPPPTVMAEGGSTRQRHGGHSARPRLGPLLRTVVAGSKARNWPLLLRLPPLDRGAEADELVGRLDQQGRHSVRLLGVQHSAAVVEPHADARRCDVLGAVPPDRLSGDLDADRSCRATLVHVVAQVAGDGLQLDAREVALLTAACREADVLARIEDELADAPVTTVGAQGQTVAHPLIGEARRSRQTVAALLRQIGLEDPAVASPGSGSRTTPWQARAAAQARHQGR